jgi:hypothetical protein
MRLSPISISARQFLNLLSDHFGMKGRRFEKGPGTITLAKDAAEDVDRDQNG